MQQEPCSKEAAPPAQQEPCSKEAAPPAQQEPRSKEAAHPNVQQAPCSKESALQAQNEAHNKGGACQELDAMCEGDGSEPVEGRNLKAARAAAVAEALKRPNSFQIQDCKSWNPLQCIGSASAHVCSLQEASLALKEGETEEQRALRIAHNIYVKFNRSTKSCAAELKC